MNWSAEVSTRMAFFALLCPTWRTAPIWLPCWSEMAYSLLTSMSLAFWFTTRIGSVNTRAAALHRARLHARLALHVTSGPCRRATSRCGTWAGADRAGRPTAGRAR